MADTAYRRYIAVTAVALLLLLITSCRSDDDTSDALVDAGTSVGEAPATTSTTEPATPVPSPTVRPTPVPIFESTPEPGPAPTSFAAGTDPVMLSDEFINRLEASVAARFGVDGVPPPLHSTFRNDDGDNDFAVSECFDRELRAAVGDEPVDEFTRERPDAQEVQDASIDALFACVSADRIRRMAISSRVISWNWYSSPPRFPARQVDEPCVQALYDTDPAEFRRQWENDAPQLAASCLWPHTTKTVRDRPSSNHEPTEAGDSLAGRRGLTLQWISWEPDEWGSIEFTPLGNDRYEVFGRQDREDGREFVIVDGIMQRINENELHLEGTVTMRLDFQDSDICVRTGDMQFLSTQGRQYWRLQDFLHCDGNTTDYVDIYFG